MKIVSLIFALLVLLGLLEFESEKTSSDSNQQLDDFSVSDGSLHKADFFKLKYGEIKQEIDSIIQQSRGDVWVEETLGGMSLEEKIGQLLMVDLNSNALKGMKSPDEVISQYHVGGFLVPRLSEPSLIYRTTRRLQTSSKIPLFFAADYERGAGRYLNNFTELPSSMALGSSRNSELAWMAGALTALEARSFGVNFILAPVVDVNNNPNNPIINIRSYAEQAGLVAEMSGAFQKGVHAYGALSTFKHFPGHGNTVTDSHYRMGTVNSSLEELEKVELFPYRKLFGENNQPDAVMTAHLWIKAINKYPRPATFSKTALQGLLRDDLGFKGIVITDDIGMGALKTKYTYTERVVTSIMAGVDILLGPQDLARTVRAISEAIENGDIPVERLNQSVERVLQAKAKIGLDVQANLSPEVYSYLNKAPIGEEIATIIAEASATSLGKWHELTPLDKEAPFSLVQISNVTKSTAVPAAMNRLNLELAKEHNLIEHRVGEFTPTSKQDAIIMAVKNSDGPIVLSLFLRIRGDKKGANLSKTQTDLVNELLSLNRKVIVVTMGSPYVAEQFPKADAFLIFYDQSIASVLAAKKALSGELDPEGRLPVSISSFPYGSGN